MLQLLVFNVIIGSISVFICCNHVLIGFVAICRVLQIEFDYTCMCCGGDYIDCEIEKKGKLNGCKQNVSFMPF